MFSHNENAKVQDHPKSSNETHQFVLARQKGLPWCTHTLTHPHEAHLSANSFHLQRRKQSARSESSSCARADSTMHKQDLSCMAKEWGKLESAMQGYSQGYPLKSARKYSSIPGVDYLLWPTWRPSSNRQRLQEKWETTLHTCDPSIGGRD